MFSFSFHKKYIVNNSDTGRIKNNKKTEKKTYLEYGFSFGDQNLIMDEIYEEIFSSNFTEIKIYLLKIKSQLLMAIIKLNCLTAIYNYGNNFYLKFIWDVFKKQYMNIIYFI